MIGILLAFHVLVCLLLVTVVLLQAGKGGGLAGAGGGGSLDPFCFGGEGVPAAIRMPPTSMAALPASMPARPASTTSGSGLGPQPKVSSPFSSVSVPQPVAKDAPRQVTVDPAEKVKTPASRV